MDMSKSLHLRLRTFSPGILLSGLLCLLCLLPAAPAEATWPGRDGAIAFGRGNYIWALRPCATQGPLTGGGVDAEPTYSRDGRMIAFVRFSDDGSSDIWVMNSNGNNERRVTATAEGEVQPAFFPGGRSLVFLRSSPSTGFTVHSIKLDGTGERRLAVGATFPTISPNGRWLAFTRRPSRNGIGLIDLRTGEERILPSGISQDADFSPDGRRLVFVGQRPCGSKGARRLALLTIGLNARRPRMLLRTCRRPFLPSSPVWSPRGNRIVFVRRDDPAGSAVSRLQMLNLRGQLIPGAPRPRSGVSDFSPSWQPLR
jgi:Tol biopolymer transport system component